MDQVMDRPAASRPGRMRRTLRALLWTALGIAALVAAAALWTNRRDEAPSADVRALEALVAAARPVAADDDAVAGIAWLEALRLAGRGTPPGSASHARTGMRASRGDALDAAFRACDAPEGECAPLLAAAERDMAGWIERERALLDGYRGLLPRRGWYEPPPATLGAPHVPPLGGAMEGQRLHHAQVLLDARAGRADAVRDALEADLRFWRAGLAGSRTLVNKMVAVRAVQRNFETGAHALARLPVGAVDAAVPAGWSEPVTAAERSLHAALAWEWKLGDTFMRTMNVEPSKLRGKHDPREPLTPLFKLQATANRNAATMRRVAQAYDAPYAQLRESMRRLHADIEDETRFPYSLYNPVGRILSAIAAPAVTGYGSRVADLEGDRRALMAVVELHRGGVASSAVKARLDASPSRNPYTGRAFEWDAAAACVRTGGLDRSRGRHCLHYSRSDTSFPTASR